MGFGIIVIGSELLTGKRRDRHMAYAIEALRTHGLSLNWCRILPDNPARITAELRETLAREDVVFSFGGIGATPDDHTRQCAAAAAEVRLVCHPEAKQAIEEQFGISAHPQRIRMADLPENCTLIPNPVNRIPGFSIEDHHFVPGFPQMAWPMMDWVLETRYAHLFKAEPPVEIILTVPNASEGQLIGIMEAFVECFPNVEFSCLPCMENDYREAELGVRGVRATVGAGVEWLITALEGEGFRWERKR